MKKMPEVYLAVIQKAEMRQGYKATLARDMLSTERPDIDDAFSNMPLQREVDMYIAAEPRIITYDPRQSPERWCTLVDQLRAEGKATIATEEYPIVTPSAGAISIYTEGDARQYISFSQKDTKAPRDPGFRVPRNGFPHSEQDWYTLNHLVQEAFEEGIFLTRKNELVLGTNEAYDRIINETAARVEAQTALRVRGTTRVPITFEDGYDTLRVYRECEAEPTLIRKGVISWTPETGFNFIQVMRVEYPATELQLVDGEYFPNGKLIGRDICLLERAKIQGKRFGDTITETVYHLNRETGEIEKTERTAPFLTDKVPRSVLSQLGVYPEDWMTESYNFLSDPRVRTLIEGQELHKIKWSALEAQLKGIALG